VDISRGRCSQICKGYWLLVLDATDFVASKGNTEMKHLNIYADMLYQSYKLEGALETVEVAV